MTRWLPLTAGPAEPWETLWSEEGDKPDLLREVVGWEEVEGQPCARIDYRLESPRRQEPFLSEWVRESSDRQALVCVQRVIAGRRVRFDPPLPLLVLPLEPGQRWSWSGTLGDHPGRAELSVVERTPSGDQGEALSVEQVSEWDGLRTRRVTRYEEGRGPVKESGDAWAGEDGLGVQGLEARLRPPSPTAR